MRHRGDRDVLRGAAEPRGTLPAAAGGGGGGGEGRGGKGRRIATYCAVLLSRGEHCRLQQVGEGRGDMLRPAGWSKWGGGHCRLQQVGAVLHDARTALNI